MKVAPSLFLLVLQIININPVSAQDSAYQVIGMSIWEGANGEKSDSLISEKTWYDSLGRITKQITWGIDFSGKRGDSTVTLYNLLRNRSTLTYRDMTLISDYDSSGKISRVELRTKTISSVTNYHYVYDRKNRIRVKTYIMSGSYDSESTWVYRYILNFSFKKELGQSKSKTRTVSRKNLKGQLVSKKLKDPSLGATKMKYKYDEEGKIIFYSNTTGGKISKIYYTYEGEFLRKVFRQHNKPNYSITTYYRKLP
jgi:hypothetical protein